MFLAGRKVFRDFLRCEYSEENIMFWLACEDLKKETSPEAIEEKARIIYEDYISILSPKEVNYLLCFNLFKLRENAICFLNLFKRPDGRNKKRKNSLLMSINVQIVIFNNNCCDIYAYE